MPSYVPFNRDQAFLLPPDLMPWLPEDDLAHFVVAAVERVPLGALEVSGRPGGKAQYHPRLMLALLIYSYANGIFSSRRIERATYRDIAVRFVAANLHSEHNTIAAFRRTNKAAFKAAFLQVLLPARESGLLKLGLARRESLEAKLDAACARLKAEARAGAAAGRPDYAAKKAAYDARKRNRGRPPKPLTRHRRLSGRAT